MSERTTHRIHITGASGCGVTTLGRALAIALGGIALDMDDFYWVPTHPPFQFKRPAEERLRLLRDSFPQDRTWILSGSCDGWGAPLIPLFDLLVFLEAPAEVRLARLRERERKRFGDAALAPGGYFHENHKEFIEWAAHYDSGKLPGRSRPRHEAWLATLTCSVLRLNSEQPVEDLVASILEHIGADLNTSGVRPASSAFSPESREKIRQPLGKRTIVVADYNPDWPRWFEELRDRIWPSVADFAISIEHVGSTSVPGLVAKPVIDMDIVVPSPDSLPLAIERLAALGYMHRGGLGIQGREAFREPAGDRKHNLYVCPADSPALHNHFTIRDYLRTHPESARAYAELKKRLALEFAHDSYRYTEEKTGFILAILAEQGFSQDCLREIREANHRGIAFDAPRRLDFLMAGFTRPWYVAGGWALDLFLETKTRPHADIEMLIFREDQLALQRHLLSLSHSFSLTKIIPGPEGGIEQPWPVGDTLDASIHQIRARSADFEFDIFIGDTDADHWIYRRDRRVIWPRNEIGSISAVNVPFLIPEIVLLFKAKNPLAKDRDDFMRVAPRLSSAARHWLQRALELAHPGCPWVGTLLNVSGGPNWTSPSR